MTKKELVEILNDYPDNWTVRVIIEDQKIKKQTEYDISVYIYDEGEIGIDLEEH